MDWNSNRDLFSNNDGDADAIAPWSKGKNSEAAVFWN